MEWKVQEKFAGGTLLYCLFDKVAETSGPIFEARNDPAAARAVQQMFKNAPDQNPDDYQLFCLGSFNKDEPLICAYEEPIVEVSFADEEVENG